MNIQQKIAKLTWWNEIIKLKDILRELASNMFVPTNYDLSEFTNTSSDPIAHISDISGGGGVTTVTGTGVDNTDPLNPIVNTPTATDIDALKRDGSNANSAIDIGTNDFFAGGIKVKNGGGDEFLDVDTGSKTVSLGDLNGAYAGNNLIIDANSGFINFIISNEELFNVNSQKILSKNSSTADLPDSTDKRYQTNAQQTNNDASSSIQGQLDDRLLISDNKLKEAGSFNQTVTAVTTVTVTLTTSQPDTLYKVNVTPTSLLASTSYYISSKTTGNFVITYATALTGGVAGDYTIYHN